MVMEIICTLAVLHVKGKNSYQSNFIKIFIPWLIEFYQNQIEYQVNLDNLKTLVEFSPHQIIY